MREQRKQLKLVVTAGSSDSRTLKAADLLDAQAVLTKPLTGKVVLQRVRQLLRSRPAPYERAEGARPPLMAAPQ
jgi:DNA-binding response OmpR family regulator